MFRQISIFLVIILVLVGCAPAPTATTPTDAGQLVNSAVSNLREADTFRIQVERTGAPYFFETELGNILFRRATAQYVAPDVIEATLRVIVAGLPTDVTLFARGQRQWFENDILTGGEWLDNPLSPGFDPRLLIESDSGFQSAVNALRDLNYRGQETLENGIATHRLSASANGPEIMGLLANLVYLTGEVTIDLFIDSTREIPARFVVTAPNEPTVTGPEPLVFTIDMYDVNAAPELHDPEEVT